MLWRYKLNLSWLRSKYTTKHSTCEWLSILFDKIIQSKYKVKKKVKFCSLFAGLSPWLKWEPMNFGNKVSFVECRGTRIKAKIYNNRIQIICLLLALGERLIDRRRWVVTKLFHGSLKSIVFGWKDDWNEASCL